MKQFPEGFGQFNTEHDPEHVYEEELEPTPEDIADLIEKQQKEDFRTDPKGIREELKRQGHPIVEEEN